MRRLILDPRARGWGLRSEPQLYSGMCNSLGVSVCLCVCPSVRPCLSLDLGVRLSFALLGGCPGPGSHQNLRGGGVSCVHGHPPAAANAAPDPRNFPWLTWPRRKTAPTLSLHPEAGRNLLSPPGKAPREPAATFPGRRGTSDRRPAPAAPRV